MPPDYFCGTLWLQTGVSSPCYPHQMAQGWGHGCSGGNGPQNPGVELHMKHSGHSVWFPPCHQQHHQYCRWALKFHTATLCATCGHRGRPLHWDMERLRQAPDLFPSGLSPKQVVLIGWVPEALQEQTDPKVPTMSPRRSGTARDKATGGRKGLGHWGQAQDVATPARKLLRSPERCSSRARGEVCRSLSNSEGFILHAMSFPGQSPPERIVPFSSTRSRNSALPVFI